MPGLAARMICIFTMLVYRPQLDCPWGPYCRCNTTPREDTMPHAGFLDFLYLSYTFIYIFISQHPDLFQSDIRVIVRSGRESMQKIDELMRTALNT